MTRLFLAILLISLFIVGCQKDPSSSNDEKKVQSVGAFIVNEGNFTKGNGSLSFYSFADQAVQNNIFQAVNKRALGDVPNSMTVWDTLGFVIVNNSNKIEVIGLKSWKSIKTIEMPAGASPRNLAVVSDSKAYITNLFANTVAVLDLKTLSLTQTSIAVGANPEELLLCEGKVYVANSGFGSGNTISVIDPTSDKVVNTIKVGDNPTALMVDDDEELYVLCTGRWPAWGDTTDTGTNGGVYVIDPKSQTVTDSILVTGHPSEITYAGNDMGFFLLNGNVVSFSTETNKILNATFIKGTFSYYALEADPISQQLFVLDAKDYQSNGEAIIYDFNGQEQKRFTVGIIPGAVTFVYE
jgi:YVTN family beta-propeller protein